MSPLKTPSVDVTAQDVPVGIWVGKAPDGEFLYANADFRALTGMPVKVGGEACYAGPTYAFHNQVGEPYPRTQLPLYRALAEKKTVTVDDLVIHRADGSKVNVRAIARPVFTEGTVSHVVVAFQDTTRDVEAEHGRKAAADEQVARLTARLRAREQAAILHERLIDAVNHAPLIIFAVDREGTFTLAEGKVLAQFGLSPAEVLGKSIFDVYRDHAAVLRNVKRALAGESFIDIVDVGPLVFETWYAPIQGPDGGVLSVATDVTERRRMQATLLSAERMVAVGTIAASVAHEINNPLSYVIACLDLLVRDGNPLSDLAGVLRARYPDDAEVNKLTVDLLRAKEPFENIRDGIERMRLIARDLRTFARVDDHELVPVDVRDVLRSAIRMSSNETRYRASVVTEFAEVPWVLASEPRLAQVFLNLLVNAAQAFPDDKSPGSCEIRISTAVDQRGGVAVTVRDNGPGIERHVLPRIFEPFFTTKPVGVGTGLGLSVCRNIVVSYGGEIVASSEVGKGTSFVVTLPPTAGPTTAPASSRRHPPSHPSWRVSVLVIDDDKVLGNAFRMTLSQEFTVRVASGGAEALQVLAEGAMFDFVFCDLMMPDMNGMEVFAELSQRRPEIAEKVLFMTGGAYTPEIRAFISRVPNRCLQKPFDPAIVIREALARRR